MPARRGSANEQREKFKEAVADYSKAVELHPADSLSRAGYERCVQHARREDPSFRAVSLSMLQPMMSPSPSSSSLTPMASTPSSPLPPTTEEANDGESDLKETPKTSVSDAATTTAAASKSPAPVTAVAAATSTTASVSASGQASAPQTTETKSGFVAVGAQVVLHSLSKDELNGQCGVAGEVQGDKGRQVHFFFLFPCLA